MEKEKLEQGMPSGEFLHKVKEANEMLQTLAQEDKDNRGFIVLACDWAADEGAAIISSGATLENISKLFRLLLKEEDMRNALRFVLLGDLLRGLATNKRSGESEKSKCFTRDETPQPREDRDFTRDETPQHENFSSNS